MSTGHRGTILTTRFYRIKILITLYMLYLVSNWLCGLVTMGSGLKVTVLIMMLKC